MTKDEAAREACRLLVEGLEEVVRDTGELGTPGGILYAAFMNHGFSLEAFESLMGAMVQAGRLEKRGQSYFIPQKKGGLNDR